eukprot:208536-Prymnesium_polylepis.1
MASPCGRPTAIAASRSTTKRQKRCLPIPPILQRFREPADAVSIVLSSARQRLQHNRLHVRRRGPGRSAARCRRAATRFSIVRQNDTF